MKTPASCYSPSPRSYPAKLAEPEYGSGLEVRRVRACGQFKWEGNNIFISETLRNEPIGLELIEEDHWLVYFSSFPIALFDSHQRSIHSLPADPDARRDGNDRTVESQEKQTTLSLPSHRPLEISPNTVRFPHSHPTAAGKKNQNLQLEQKVSTMSPV